MRKFSVVFIVCAILITVFPVNAQSPKPVSTLAEIKSRQWQSRIGVEQAAPMAEEKEIDIESAYSAQSLEDVATDTRVVFQSYRDGNWEIYRANGDFFTQLNMTKNSAADIRPELSFNGQKIVFASNRSGNFEIYSMNWDGSGLVQLTTHASVDSSPSWSSDGTRIAFVSNRDGNSEVYVMNADGSGQTRLTFTADGEYGPAWSVTGRLAWASAAANSAYGSAIVANADGSGAYPIATLRFLGSPVWSHDGTQLYMDGDTDDDYFSELVIGNADGSNRRTIYNPPGQYVDAWSSSWSPDDSSLAFTRIEYRVDGNSLVKANSYLETVSVTGGVSNRKPGTNRDELPSWRWNDVLSPKSLLSPLAEFSQEPDVRLVWNGVDFGPAGVVSYDIQFRVGTAGTWEDWRNNVPPGSDVISGISGTTYFYRIRAHDSAGNVEPWIQTPNFNTTTTFFRYKTFGKVVDSRGAPVPYAQVSGQPNYVIAGNPATTGVFGDYIIRMISSGSLQLQSSKSGYGSFAPIQSATQDNANLPLAYLPGQNSVVSDGDFETGLSSGWSTNLLSSTRVVSNSATGDSALKLGQDCITPTVVESTSPISGTGSPFGIGIAMDVNGLPHVMWSGFHAATSGIGFYYSQRLSNGTWTLPETLDTARWSGMLGDYKVSLNAGLNGEMHLVWNASPNIFYATRKSDGTYTPRQTVAQGVFASSDVDLYGGIHIICKCGPGMAYVYRDPSGVWHPIIDLGKGDLYGFATPAIHANASGTVGFLWIDFKNLLYRSRSTTGSLSPLEIVAPIQDYDRGPMYLATDGFGQTHAIWSSGGKLSYFVRSPAGKWSLPTEIADVTATYEFFVDQRGVPFLLGSTGQFISPTTMRYLRINEGTRNWSPKIPIVSGSGDGYARVMRGATDKDGRFHVIWDQYVYSIVSCPTGAAASTRVSTVVNIPTTFNRPTLAFMERGRGFFAGTTSKLRLQLEDDNHQQSTISLNTPLDWTQSWFDMSDWKGKTVTITWSIEQSASEPAVNVWLDSISLSSWDTPIISDTSFHKLPSATSATSLTLTGLNFIQTPTIKVGATQLTNVQWQGDGSLVVTIPAGLSPGIYDITVINPGGQEAVLPNALQIGERTLVPLVTR